MSPMPVAREAQTESFLPVLSTGRHRNPRRGACFMEYASYLAGERWSDHPSCTHPTLAALARLVNDLTSDSARPLLALWIPSVVGLDCDDPRLPVVIAALAAARALPIASEPRQRALATALLRCEELLEHEGGAVVAGVREQIRDAFRRAPGSESWAQGFIDEATLRVPHPLLPGDDAILRTAVLGIADACVSDSDARLNDLLASAIDACGRLIAAVPAAAPAEEKVPAFA